MRYMALACDYDGTLATKGFVEQEVISALERLVASGRKLIMVSGRELPDLMDVFPAIHLFDWLVLENGALLYQPSTREERLIAEPPPERFVEALRLNCVDPILVGKSIVATRVPHETTVVEVIRELGLEHHVIFNKGAVMVLPSGVNKATGLKVALTELGISPHNTVGIGDAENDHAMLSLCECGVAVANALPSVMERAHLITEGRHGAGVIELIDRMLKTDLAELEPALFHHHIPLGTRTDGQPVGVSPYGTQILLAGPSGSGKSTATMGILESLTDARYQFCLVDPEGDYQEVAGAITLGNTQQPPTIEEILQLLKNPRENAVVNLLGVPLADRPAFFGALLPHLEELRSRTGRPHWLVIDEAHHLLPASLAESLQAHTWQSSSIILITVHPELVCPRVLEPVDVVIAVGKFPDHTLREFSAAIGLDVPTTTLSTLEPGHVLAWFRNSDTDPSPLRIIPPKGERRRHQRKYAEGDVGAEKSFVFQGPDGRLKLRAQNLMIFLQIAEGVDDDTWLHHLRRRDYSHWFEDAIKDHSLATAAAFIETQEDIPAGQSRELIRKAIETRYRPPA